MNDPPKTAAHDAFAKASRAAGPGAVRNVMFWADALQKPAADGDGAPPVVRLKGSIEGNIHLTVSIEMVGDADVASIIVERAGRVEGRIAADRVEVSGEVDGLLVADYVHVRAGGRLRGRVEYVRIKVDEGANIDADCRPRADLNGERAASASAPAATGHEKGAVGAVATADRGLEAARR